MKISTSGAVSTVAGGNSSGPGAPGSTGDGGPAAQAQIGIINYGLTVDSAGNLYIAEGNGNIRKVDTQGLITTIAGVGTLGYSGDGGPATMASISPDGLAVDSAGNIFICAGSRVREISGGIIPTIAGNGSSNVDSGDGGLATAASLGCYGVAVDGADNVFIPEGGTNRVRRISSAGIITTVAGDGNAGYSGDGGPASIARVQTPSAVAVSPSGNLWFDDTGNNAVRMLQPIGQSIAISAVFDAATESPMPLFTRQDRGHLRRRTWAFATGGVSAQRVAGHRRPACGDNGHVQWHSSAADLYFRHANRRHCAICSHGKTLPWSQFLTQARPRRR